jgi:tetratricopeptide (TPR) repeat protein
MKKTTIVAFLILASSKLLASNISSEINEIESNWANIYYSENNSQQRQHYPALIERPKKLSQEPPNEISPVIWQAIIIATNAAYQSPFTALESITTAKKLLEHCIKVNPQALDGTALVVLGTLYYMTPGWPISFGDQDKAELLFLEALKINPDSIDSNYFYADYLLSQDNLKKAQKYFKRALQAPTRTHQQFADTQLKQEALIALENSKFRKLEMGKNKFFSLFSSANSQ